MQRAHDILVFALDAANDRLGVDADGRLRRTHISILITVDLEIVAEDTLFRAAFDLDDAAFLDRELDPCQYSTERVHSKVDHELSVGAALDGRHIELTGRK